MSILRASDLSLVREADPLWRRRACAPAGEGACEPYELVAKLGLPRGGFASPLGFWMAPAAEWASPPPYRLEVAPLRRPGAILHAGNGSPGIAAGRCLRAVVAERRRTRASAERPPRLVIEVASRSARIAVDEAAWPEAREVGLLAVATCWRLDAIDATLDRLTDQARRMLGRPESVTRDGTSLSWRDFRLDAQVLLLDLADFEGPLTDPSSVVPSREAARLYRRLCGRLGLFAWRDRIDERAEVVEGLLETLSARREHRQVIALQVALEVLIIALLATDVALSLLSIARE
jgi:hypothetical protein